VIRTVLKDISPDSVTGEILFHEHMSVAYNRTERQLTLPPPSTADIRPVIADVKEAAKAGVSLIVDGGIRTWVAMSSNLSKLPRKPASILWAVPAST
jgi:predicted metal-dependent phosphotriesterase family hydrolase